MLKAPDLHSWCSLCVLCALCVLCVKSGSRPPEERLVMRENRVKAKLQAGEPSFGVLAWGVVTSGLPAVLEMGGAEFCIFDMEHSGLSLETMKSLIRWCRGTSVVPLVRVP